MLRLHADCLLHLRATHVWSSTHVALGTTFEDHAASALRTPGRIAVGYMPSSLDIWFLGISEPRFLATLHTASVCLPQQRISLPLCILPRCFCTNKDFQNKLILHQSTLPRHFRYHRTLIPLISNSLLPPKLAIGMSGVTTFCTYTPSSQVLHVPRPAVRTLLPHKYDKYHNLLYIHPFLTNASHLEQHKTPHQAFAQPGIKGDARSAESPIQPDPNDRYQYDSGAWSPEHNQVYRSVPPEKGTHINTYYLSTL